MLAEFRAFLVKTNALALAIGVIIGGALGTVVTSLVEDIIMPPVGKLLGGVDFSALAIDMGGGAAIRYGAFLNAVIAFIVIAFVVWQISRTFIKEDQPEIKTCPFCREPNASRRPSVGRVPAGSELRGRVVVAAAFRCTYESGWW